MTPSKGAEKTGETPKAEATAIVQVVRKSGVGQNYSPEQMALKKKIVCDLFATGTTTFARAAKVAQVHRNTLRNWQRQDPAFDQAINDARAVAIEVLATEAYICALKAKDDPQYQRSLFKVLEAEHPAYRSARQATTNNQTMTIAMQINNMSEEELMRLTPIVPLIQALP